MGSEYSWWVRLVALVTGKKPHQIAWKLRQQEGQEEQSDSEPAPPRPAPIRPAHFRKEVPWWHGVVPEFARDAPMTFVLGAVCMAWYLLGVLATEGDMGAFSSYTIQHFGATNGILIHSGEFWRVITSNFVHHDLVHLAFNLYALAIAGRVVEELFGSGKALVGFLITGVVAMTFSHMYNTYWSDLPQLTSGGASGSLCGMMGMAMVGGHRLGTRAGIHIRNGMGKWAAYLVLFGILVPFVNNAAHGGGFVAGCALGAVLPFGFRRQSSMQTHLFAWVAGVVIVGALSLQIQSWDGSPAGVRGLPRSVFGMVLESDPNLRMGQLPGLRECVSWSPPRMPSEELQRACRHMVKSMPACREGWELLEAQGRILGDEPTIERGAKALELGLSPCFR